MRSARDLSEFYRGSFPKQRQIERHRVGRNRIDRGLESMKIRAGERTPGAGGLLLSVGSPSADHDIERFVLELLRTGSMLSGLVSDLSAELPAGAYPGEESGAIVFEMLCGTIRTALLSADPRDVQMATELIDLAGARALEHLQLACELSQRIHGDDGGRRTYG